MVKKRLFTVEYLPEDEMIEIHFDKMGIEWFVKFLQDIKERKSDHYDLMIKEWGGGELTSVKQNLESKLIPHLKILYWDSEQA